MSYFEIFILAIALSVDACAVSFSYGLAFKENRLKNSLLLASFTGVFQGLMPVFGYYLTSIVRGFIEPYTKWIIFSIFMFLGVKFIKESFEQKQKPCCIGLACLFLIGVATSVDAFSAGISLALYNNNIFFPALLIAIITFINSCFGFFLGGNLKNMPTRVMEVSAGVLLIFLGIKAIL